MWYAHVLVADASYHRDEPLTYASQKKLEIGSVVVVPLQKKRVLGIVSELVDKPSFSAKEILEYPELAALPRTSLDLLAWMREYYPAPLGITTQLFLPDSLPKKPNTPNEASRPFEPVALPSLTNDQAKALKEITQPGLHILHGQTGSGKTRVYVELAMRMFDMGRSSIILTPEIGLTSQLANTFRSVFGERVVVMHSGLTGASRRRAWLWLLEQKTPVVVVGARSALFGPLGNVGLIVADESHETSYKQDQAPYYHTVAVAAKLGSLQKAMVVLGSATPLVSDYFIAKAKGRPIIGMHQVAAGATSPEEAVAHVVDLKDRNQFSKSPYLSTAIIDGVKESLGRHEQVLLFLNRRGTARVIFCEKCGWQAACPHCDLPLVYHGDHHAIRCHSCSYKAPAPSSCPACKSPDVVFKSVGTKAIAQEAKRLFPEAKIMRFDTDNKKSERLESHYDNVRAGDVDILVGTQTLAKGLDLPKLGLVGVVIADTGLYFPDFSAQERTYQLLSQVLGRIGRGHRQGRAIIQTYSPESPLLKAVLTKNWDIFYNTELEERRAFLFPPFCYVLKLSCKRASSTRAQENASEFAEQLRRQNNNIKIEGPAPAFHEKVQNKFIWQLIIKAKRREHLTRIIKQLPSGWSYDIDPMNLL